MSIAQRIELIKLAMELRPTSIKELLENYKEILKTVQE